MVEKAAEKLYLGVDLAQRHSAAVLIDAEYKVHGEWFKDFGAWPKNGVSFEALEAAKSWAKFLKEEAPLSFFSGWLTTDLVIGVENVSHFMVNPKPAIMVQAAHLLGWYTEDNDYESSYEPRLVLANVWQNKLGYKRGKGADPKKWAVDKATELGYSPLGGTAKSREDRRDAYLLARYLRDLDLGS